MALKGKTTFELTNAETGEVKVVEDHNMLTNGLRHLLTTYPWEFNLSPAQKLMYPYSTGSAAKSAQMLTGGLMLFDTALEENVDNIIPPAGAQTVGCGTNKAYSGFNTMAGSYNITESGPVTDEEGVINGYKHVWDFSTSQGNGHIACACLTTREGGYTAGGTYPFSSDYMLTDWGSSYMIGNRTDLYLYRDFFNHKWSDGNYRFPVLYADYNQNTILTPHDIRCLYNYNNSSYGFINTRQLVLDVRRFPFSNVSVHDWRNSTNNNDVPNIGIEVSKTVTIPMPATLQEYFNACDESYYTANGSNSSYTKASHYFGYSSDDGFIYFWFNRRVVTNNNGKDSVDYYWYNGADLQIWKINATDFTSEHFTIPNATGKSIHAYKDYSYGRTNESLCIFNNYILAVPYFDTSNYAQKSRLLIIDISNPANVREVTYPDGTPVSARDNKSYANTYYTYYRFGFSGNYKIGNKVYFWLEGLSVCVDLITGVMMYTNRYSPVDFEQDLNNYNNQQVPSSQYVYGSPGIVINSINDNKIYIRRGTDIMLTINNLDTPVTKTAAETMKVTYTLLETEDIEGAE